MATRCPKCSTPNVVSAREIGASGRLMTCSGCGTNWLARHCEGTFYGPEKMLAPPPLTARDPLIIEGEVVASPRTRPPPRPSPTRSVSPSPPRAKAGRYAISAAVALLIAVFLLVPAVSALPLFGGMFGDEGVTLRGITTKTIELRGTEAIFIEGEIVNGTDREVAVPAVRISLHSGGDEVYSWLIEPSVLRVPAGGIVGFRSARANPAPGADDIALSLSARRPDAAR